MMNYYSPIRRLTFFLITALMSFGLTKAQTFEMVTLQEHAGLDDAINIVYLAEGYTASEQNAFQSSVQSINSGFFSESPFSNYKDFFNVFAIKVISEESGGKHPRTASDCPPAGQFPAMNPNNYFGTTFDYGGIHRLVVPVNMGQVMSIASSHLPQYDQILVLVNTTQYGGSGGTVATGTEHSSSVQLMLHEVGHSFAGLADEYWAGVGYAGERPNMTHSSLATPELVKWKEWLGVSNVGIHQHCCGSGASDWFKPTDENCMMELLSQPFCPVCKQRIIEKIYEMVNPIIAYEPSSGSVEMNGPMNFKITDLLKPTPNTQSIKWILNGNTLSGTSEAITLYHSDLDEGNNTLEVVVTDETDMLRVAPSYTNHIHKVTWMILKGELGIDLESELVSATVKIYPNPAVNTINIEAKGLSNASGLADIKIYDLSGRMVLNSQENIKGNELKKQLDVSSLIPGLYVLEVGTDKLKEQFKIIIAK